MPLPYQPSLLRLLHGATALLVLPAWLTGLVVYARHDGRFGRLHLVPDGPWIDIHGTVGVLLWPMALLFGVYAISAGRARLRQGSNAVALLALALAVVSGKLMQEHWLRAGQLHHVVYNLHLTAWLLLSVAVLWHVAAVLRRGGQALAGSMVQLRVQANDRPRHWLGQLQRGLRRAVR
jgi:hypothetical protein